MTVSYSLNVSQATFAGFLKLLLRWSGSIYKGMWREALIFCTLFLLLQILLRHGLAADEKSSAWIVIQFVDAVGEDVPYSFVLGFYVSFVASRWMTQFATVPWPDRLCHSIEAYVQGSDERSRVIRRTLGRYAYLLQILTYQHVSTSVKKRFPRVQHLVEAGLMTPEEMAVFEKTNFDYGKWWLPAHWFTSLAVRAQREGRIKDSVLLKALLEELLSYRTMCAMTIAYDWICVPLAYTQVATITAYFKAFTLLVGKQTLEGASGFTVDFYFPFVTIYKFLWTVGWLKVAQQILNPYGEDDDDFELNWTLDRSVQLVYDTVDRYHLLHPKLRKDAFWDVQDIRLPQTAHSAKYMKNPDLGSAFRLVIDEVNYLPMDDLCEKDVVEYKNQSMKRKDATRQNSSFIRRVLRSGFSQKSRKAGVSKSWQGISNSAFSMEEDTTHPSPKSNLRNLVKKMSPENNRGPFKLNSAPLRQNSYTADEREGSTSEKIGNEALKNAKDNVEGNDFEPDHSEDDPMPCIPEEASRANSVASLEVKVDIFGGASQQTFDMSHEATEERTDSASIQEKWKDESCGDRSGKNDIPDRKVERGEMVVTIEDKNNKQ